MKPTQFVMKPILPMLAALAAGACALTPVQQSQIDNLAATVAPLVQAYAQTGHVTRAQAIPAALNSLAVFDPAASVDTAQLSAQIQHAVSAYTDNTGGSTGQKIASAVLASLPAKPSGAQVNAALAQAGSGATDGANR